MFIARGMHQSPRGATCESATREELFNASLGRIHMTADFGTLTALIQGSFVSLQLLGATVRFRRGVPSALFPCKR